MSLIDQGREVSRQDAKGLRQKAQRLATAGHSLDLQLAEVLYQSSAWKLAIGGRGSRASVRALTTLRPLYEYWGFRTWAEWVEIDPNMHAKKAERLRAVYHHFYIKLAGAWDTKLALPISKMRELKAIATKSNVEELLKWAAKVPFTEVARQVAIRMGKRDPDAPPRPRKKQDPFVARPLPPSFEFDQTDEQSPKHMNPARIGSDGKALFTFSTQVTAAELNSIEGALRIIRAEHPARKGTLLAEVCNRYRLFRERVSLDDRDAPPAEADDAVSHAS